ncbi:thymidylate synthase (plasmid) [Klebsiella variicola]|nr:thymidylate synthase [Klebsiella variicola]
MAGAFVHFGFDVHIYNNHWSRLKSYWLAIHPSRPTLSSSSRTNGKSWMTSKWDGVQIFGYEPLPWIEGSRLAVDMARGMYELCEI